MNVSCMFSYLCFFSAISSVHFFYIFFLFCLPLYGEIKICVNRFNHFQNIVLTNLVTDGWTDKQSNRLRTHCLCLSVWPGGAIMRADSFNKTTELAEDNG